MRYVTTRSQGEAVTASKAILTGLAPDGGLYVPERMPALTADELRALTTKSYAERAAYVMSLYFDEFSAETLRAYAEAAYGAQFDTPAVAPVVTRAEGIHILELWHGPTAAFKDMALQMLPRLLTGSLNLQNTSQTALILTATSGDTGKAALEGFADVPGTHILVFYPKDGISSMQERQMVTQEGQNVGVFANAGNFDDAQTAVKALFTDPEVSAKLKEKNVFFSSANSINLGRLVPQIVYYISAYCDLVRDGKIAQGDKINVCVPTGNFGNILSALYAREMGLPIQKLICASNRNSVLTDFLRTGTYTARRPFYTTLSPSMDILISSNLERALYYLCDGQAALVSDWMRDLRESGSFSLQDAQLARFSELFYADTCDDAETLSCMEALFPELLIDPHTAVGYRVLEKYRRETGDNTPALLCATASPYKFPDAVLSALDRHISEEDKAELTDDFRKLALISRLSGTNIPGPLMRLQGKPVRFTRTLQNHEMSGAVSAYIEERM